MSIAYEQQVQLRGPDGAIQHVGTALMGIAYQMFSSEASAAFAVGDAARFDTTNSVIPRLDVTAAGAAVAADLPQVSSYKVLRIAGATDTMFVGVALEPIPAGKRGLITGVGSITTVNTTAVAITAGAHIGGSATAGLAAANGNTTQILGACFKTNTVGGTGSTGKAGILVGQR